MGYTHYWRPVNAGVFSEKQWKQITANTVKLFQNLPADVKIDDQLGGQPLVDDKQIFFNGVAPEDHETFVLDRRLKPFEFCKTAHKPYDLAVTAVLLLASFFAPDVIRLSSDGEESDWQPAQQWIKQTLGLVVPIKLGS